MSRSLPAAMIPVAVAMVVTPDRLAPIDVMVAAGFNGDTWHPHIHLGACGWDVGGTERAQGNAGSKQN